MYRIWIGSICFLENPEKLIAGHSEHSSIVDHEGEPTWAPRMHTLQLLLSLLTVAVSVVSRLSSLPRLSGLAAVLMSLEQSNKKLFAPAEIRSPQPSERISKVDHAAVGSQIENTECPCDL